MKQRYKLLYDYGLRIRRDAQRPAPRQRFYHESVAQREPRSFEVDIAASLTNGRMLTGAITWGNVGIDVHAKHLRDLANLADAGQPWAQ